MNKLSSRREKLSEIGLFYSAAIWGSTFFVVKDVLEFIDPMILLGYRFLLGALFAGMFCLFTKKSLFKNFFHGSVLGFLLWLLFIAQTIGLSITTASNSGFITGLFIIFIPLLSFTFFRKIPSKFDSLAIFFSLLGLWILTGGLVDINLGDLLTIITAIAYAIHVIIVDKYLREGDSAFVLGFQQFLISGTISMMITAIFGIQFSILNTNTISTILFLALFPTFLAFIIQNLAQKIVKPLRVSIILAFEPLFAAIFAWTLGNESIIFHRLLGGVFIVLGLMISGMSNRN